PSYPRWRPCEWSGPRCRRAADRSSWRSDPRLRCRPYVQILIGLESERQGTQLLRVTLGAPQRKEVARKSKCQSAAESPGSPLKGGQMRGCKRHQSGIETAVGLECVDLHARWIAALVPDAEAAEGHVVEQTRLVLDEHGLPVLGRKFGARLLADE